MLLPVFVLGGFVGVYVLHSGCFALSGKFDMRQAHLHLSYTISAICFATMVSHTNNNSQ
jgi:hypothetical protein